MHICEVALTTPNKIAYLMAGTGESVTYAQLDERSNQVAQMLCAKGVMAGDHIAIMLENNARFFEIVWGAQRAGVTFTALSTRLKVNEIAYILDNSNSKLFITSLEMMGLADESRDHMPKVKTKLMMHGTLEGYQSYEKTIAAYPKTPISDQAAGGDMLYSSGTTGMPKGVKTVPDSDDFKADTTLTNVMRSAFGFTNETVYLSPAPLYHAAPMRFCQNVMRIGGTCIIMEHFEPESYLQLIVKHKITHTQLVPTMFVRMLKLDEAVRKKYDVSSLKTAIHAAAPCPVPIKEQMIAWWGQIIWEYYAGTEGNGMTITPSNAWLLKKGTVGKAVIGILKICDDEGEELPIGETGTVYFAEGKDYSYHNDEAKTKAAKNAKGWTTLGDVGFIDKDGFLFLTDRKAFMIISGGVNIYPQEVENLLVTHEKVLDVAVFGVPNDDFGEEVKAVVQLKHLKDAGEATALELIAFCHAHLSKIKCPKSIDFTDELPRHATGKLYKRLLKDKYWNK